jgi:hypothetical protein
VTASVSQDGSTWTQLGQASFSMPCCSTMQAGAAVLSHDTTKVNTAHFDSLSMLPVQRQSTDIGRTGVPGDGQIEVPSNNVFTVTGGGADIWGVADSFQFVHFPLGTGFLLDYNVLRLDNTHPFAKAGLMVRDGIAANAVNVIVDVKPNGEIEFMARQCVGCPTQYLGGAMVTLPINLYIERNGSTFTVLYGDYFHGAFTGNHETTVIGSVTLPMGDSVEAGFAVTSHDLGKLNTAQFDHPAR